MFDNIDPNTNDNIPDTDPFEAEEEPVSEPPDTLPMSQFPFTD